MYYELYVDVLFLVNFFMDYIILLFVWKVLHCETRHIRIIAGAGVGALLTCVLIILPISSVLLEMLLFHTFVNTCMIQVGLKIKNISVFLRAFFLLYIGSILMGGILNAVGQYVKISALFFFFVILGYYLSLGIWNFLSKLQRWNSCHIKVKLLFQNQEIELDALVDTGNSLYDEITGKPVSILSKQIGERFLEEEVRYISIRTVTNGESFLPLICVEKLWILDENNSCYKNVLFAVAGEEFSKNGMYKVILNPNLF